MSGWAPSGFRQAGIIYLAETEQVLPTTAGGRTTMRGPISSTPRCWARTRRHDARRHGALEGRSTASDGRASRARRRRPGGGGAAGGCDDPHAMRGARPRSRRRPGGGRGDRKGRIACDQVVLAGGAWSRRFYSNLGIYLPQLMVVNSVQRTRPIDAGIEVGGKCPRFGLRRLDGSAAIRWRMAC